MHVRNVHQRIIPRTTAEVGRLLDSLASDHDALWPRGLWSAMRFDRPLGIGADGGHGPIRYAVVEYEPGHHIRFRFSSPRGLIGCHWLEVIPDGEGTLLRHTIEMSTQGIAKLKWPLFIRPLHDALIEDAFATAEASLGLVPTVVPWTLRVKLLRWLISHGTAPAQHFAVVQA